MRCRQNKLPAPERARRADTGMPHIGASIRGGAARPCGIGSTARAGRRTLARDRGRMSRSMCFARTAVRLYERADTSASTLTCSAANTRCARRCARVTLREIDDHCSMTNDEFRHPVIRHSSFVPREKHDQHPSRPRGDGIRRGNVGGGPSGPGCGDSTGNSSPPRMTAKSRSAFSKRAARLAPHPFPAP